jgi:hypothetical protein
MHTWLELHALFSEGVYKPLLTVHETTVQKACEYTFYCSEACPFDQLKTTTTLEVLVFNLY